MVISGVWEKERGNRPNQHQSVESAENQPIRRIAPRHEAERSELIETQLASLAAEQSENALDLLDAGLRARGVFITKIEATGTGGSGFIPGSRLTRC